MWKRFHYIRERTGRGRASCERWRAGSRAGEEVSCPAPAERRGHSYSLLTWVIEAKGFGKSVIGGLFARVYSKSLDRAIPLLVEEMNAGRV
jgi:hypothetical protein